MISRDEEMTAIMTQRMTPGTSATSRLALVAGLFAGLLPAAEEPSSCGTKRPLKETILFVYPDDWIIYFRSRAIERNYVQPAFAAPICHFDPAKAKRPGAHSARSDRVRADHPDGQIGGKDGAGLKDPQRASSKLNRAVESVKKSRLEKGRTGKHDGSDQRPEQAGAGPQQISGDGRTWPGVPSGRQALAKRLITHLFHRDQSAGFSWKCRRFRPLEQWKGLAFSDLRLEAHFPVGQSGTAFVLSGD
jgi:hypothetical protein